jgi:hypothetical protein
VKSPVPPLSKGEEKQGFDSMNEKSQLTQKRLYFEERKSNHKRGSRIAEKPQRNQCNRKAANSSKTILSFP